MTIKILISAINLADASTSVRTILMKFILMRRKAVLLCLLAAVQRAVGQSPIGASLPCEAVGEDPDQNNPRDNLACPSFSGLQCFSSAQLCDGPNDCPGGTDEGFAPGFAGCGKLTYGQTRCRCVISCVPDLYSRAYKVSKDRQHDVIFIL